MDCCISCCGEKNVALPEGITANDIVTANRIITSSTFPTPTLLSP